MYLFRPKIFCRHLPPQINRQFPIHLIFSQFMQFYLIRLPAADAVGVRSFEQLLAIFVVC